MKRLFMVLCVLIMFFGIAGCPEDNNNLASRSNPSTFVSKQTADINNTIPIGNEGGNSSAVPEPTTLILLGSGLVGLAGVGRKKFFKKD